MEHRRWLYRNVVKFVADDVMSLIENEIEKQNTNVLTFGPAY